MKTTTLGTMKFVKGSFSGKKVDGTTLAEVMQAAGFANRETGTGFNRSFIFTDESLQNVHVEFLFNEAFTPSIKGIAIKSWTYKINRRVMFTDGVINLDAIAARVHAVNDLISKAMLVQ